MISEISSGSYGKVHKVFHKVDGLMYAMKSISKSKVFLWSLRVKIINMGFYSPALGVIDILFYYTRFFPNRPSMTMLSVKSKTKSAFFSCAVIILFSFRVCFIGKTVEISSLVSCLPCPNLASNACYQCCLWFPRFIINSETLYLKIHILN